jgi:hypothetical protein
MIRSAHGGHCCGRKHVFQFYGSAKNARHLLRQNLASIGSGILVEAVLTDHQCRQYQKMIEEEGFKHICRFYNSNSGNFCNVFFFWQSPKGCLTYTISGVSVEEKTFSDFVKSFFNKFKRRIYDFFY